MKKNLILIKLLCNANNSKHDYWFNQNVGLLQFFIWENYNPNQNTPGVKKVAAKNLKKCHAEKDVKSKWAAKASCC